MSSRDTVTEEESTNSVKDIDVWQSAVSCRCVVYNKPTPLSTTPFPPSFMFHSASYILVCAKNLKLFGAYC